MSTLPFSSSSLIVYNLLQNRSRIIYYLSLKSLLLAMLVGLMMVGCGEEVEVPDMIACVCGKGISSKSEACPNCGHPTPDSVVASKEAQELARIRAEFERERPEKERRLAAIKAEEQRELAVIRAEEERKRQELITKRVKPLIEKRENFVTDKKLEMLWVKPGAFMMGDTGEPHQVTLTKGFYLGKYEVTQAQWERVMVNNPSYFKGADRPVGKVSWNDAVEFCKKLTEMEKKAGRVPQGMCYQLPTEAQWEYACRAGTTTVYSWGDTITKTNANYRKNVVETTPVGKYSANPWGFHDMHGNVSEWCADWYGDYPSGAVTDSEGPASGSPRVMRGGSCYNTGSNLRSARRNGITPSFRYNGLGFRVGFQSSK
jgi:formylglycine-generating enzyme required for sulfatase activity